jgi:hypothetical protein
MSSAWEISYLCVLVALLVAEDYPLGVIVYHHFVVGQCTCSLNSYFDGQKLYLGKFSCREPKVQKP